MLLGGTKLVSQSNVLFLDQHVCQYLDACLTCPSLCRIARCLELCIALFKCAGDIDTAIAAPCCWQMAELQALVGGQAAPTGQTLPNPSNPNPTGATATGTTPTLVAQSPSGGTAGAAGPSATAGAAGPSATAGAAGPSATAGHPGPFGVLAAPAPIPYMARPSRKILPKDVKEPSSCS